MLTDRERAIRQRLKDDFEHYANKCLKIRTKLGSVESFTLNKAQLYLHQRLEEQLKNIGKVRAIILKGRQQGCSTYVGGRYYWKVTHRKGVRAFILTHEEEATNNLFDMTKRYHEHNHIIVKPSTSASNAKELIFDRLDSGYKLGTAGNKSTGRSQTLQYLHGSEVAFWPHADEHAAGVMQAVPDASSTEIILESTANGIGNYYHKMWQQAERGESEYQAIFIPWYWQNEYSKPAPAGFFMSTEETEYQEAYGLTLEQMVWRRAKIAELKGDENRFDQEYPATAAIAFQTSSEDSFIQPSIIIKARKNIVDSPYGPKVGGLDPARFGDDRTSLCIRQGRKVLSLQSWEKKDTMEVVGLAVRAIQEEGLVKLFIDVGGLGAGIVDRLLEMGYGDQVIAVNAGEKAIDSEKYFNKRAEMWGEMKEWLKSDNTVDIPDRDSLHGDLAAPTYSYDSNGRLKLERKEDMKKRGLRSPDEGDALGLTFALPVSEAIGKPLQYNTQWIV